MTGPKAHTLDGAGAVLTYDIRVADASAEPVLLLIGSPMDATGFGALADHITDRTVVTYDPRGTGRSERTEDALETTPEAHADDLRRLLSALDAGPVDIFASSGGAVNALALVARHPEQVRTLVAHEPPAAQLLPDREEALDACVDIHHTYLRGGRGLAMAKFITLVTSKGTVPADFADGPFPAPEEFGFPAEDDGSRDDSLLGQNWLSCTHYRYDIDALRAAGTRVIVGVGAESAGELAHRGGVAVAEQLGADPVTFPGGHAGFLGDEGMGDPDAFATALRGVLAAS